MTLSWKNIVFMDGNHSGPVGLVTDYDFPMSSYTDWWLRSLEESLTGGQFTFQTRQKVSLLGTENDGPDATLEAALSGGRGRPAKGKVLRLYSAHPFEYGPVLGAIRKQNEPFIDDRSARELQPGSVLMGIIDDGIALANSQFLKHQDNSEKLVSRAEYFWNQDAELEGPETSRSYQVPFGRDWDSAELERVFDNARCHSTDFPDQDQVNRALEMDKILSNCAQHGTHVMDLATGYNHRDMTANELGEVPGDCSHLRPIIAVQLARIATRESSGAFMSTYVTEALNYILVRAQQLQPEKGTKIPLVINFSYGIFAGTLSGNDHMEEWIDIAIEKVTKEFGFPIFVTLPAGNSYLEKCHGERKVRRSTSVKPPKFPDFELLVQPDNNAPTVVEFHWPETTNNAPETLGVPPDLVTRKPGDSKGIRDLPAKLRKDLLETQTKVLSDLHLFLWPPGADQPLEVKSGRGPNFYHGAELRDSADRLVGMLYHERLIALAEKRLAKDGQEDDDLEDEQPPTGKPALLSEVRKLTLILAPTQFEQSLYSREMSRSRPKLQQNEASIPAGKWGIALARTGDHKIEDTVTVRCQRGDTPFGFRPFGRQSRLEDFNYHDYAPDGRVNEKDNDRQWVLRRGTLSAIATGQETIRVGSYRLSNLDRRDVPTNRVESGASLFSSAAYGDDAPDDLLRWWPRKTIDVAAATEISHALPGIKATGTHSGSSFRFSGTSSAAPQVARWLAASVGSVMQQKKKTGKSARISVRLQAKRELKNGTNFAPSKSKARTGVALLKGPRAR
ncbi:hypothetical protein [Labrenzia sp. VG12]|uniref:hypothetical protein n=1 Tax=Labrenzia sp. VG12 TaxID=2021862 RepID=UPI000B8BFFD2|nr:hypothetical protein [Labrenzia sp. VG12]ASP32780.1 hypothetical protein CHH27_05570 [Labrenzia sp. VG12]